MPSEQFYKSALRILKENCGLLNEVFMPSERFYKSALRILKENCGLLNEVFMPSEQFYKSALRDIKGRDTLRQIVATRRRDTLLQQIASCGM